LVQMDILSILIISDPLPKEVPLLVTQIFIFFFVIIQWIMVILIVN